MFKLSARWRLAYSVLVVFSSTLCALPSSLASAEDDQFAAAVEWKKATFQRFKQHLKAPLEKRLVAMPDDLFKGLVEYDQSIGIESASAYATRSANEKEKTLFRNYIDLLPSAHKRILDKKLVAVVLIDNFGGAGYSDWLVGEDNQVYYQLVLNSALLENSLDDWLTYKSNSVFSQAKNDPHVRITTGTDYKALLYALLHEGTHLVDFERGLTPFVEPIHRKFVGRDLSTTAFVERVWLDQRTPVTAYEFEHRSGLNVYGIFPDRPLVPSQKAVKMFGQLKQTPFVSFYSASSWNEHIADFVTYYHIEKHLGGKVKLELKQNGVVLSEYRPMQTSAAKSLMPAVEQL